MIGEKREEGSTCTKGSDQLMVAKRQEIKTQHARQASSITMAGKSSGNWACGTSRCLDQSSAGAVALWEGIAHTTWKKPQRHGPRQAPHQVGGSLAWQPAPASRVEPCLSSHRPCVVRRYPTPGARGGLV